MTIFESAFEYMAEGALSKAKKEMRKSDLMKKYNDIYEEGISLTNKKEYKKALAKFKELNAMIPKLKSERKKIFDKYELDYDDNVKELKSLKTLKDTNDSYISNLKEKLS